MERRFHRRLEKNGDTDFKWHENEEGKGDGDSSVPESSRLKIIKKWHNFLISEQIL